MVDTGYLDDLDKRILTLIRGMASQVKGTRVIDVAGLIGDIGPGSDAENYQKIYRRMKRLYRLGELSMTEKARYFVKLGPTSGPYELKSPVNVVPVPTTVKEAALMTKQDRVLITLAVADEPLHIPVIREVVGIPYNQTTAILSKLLKEKRVYRPERGYYRITSGPANGGIYGFVRDNRF